MPLLWSSGTLAVLIGLGIIDARRVTEIRDRLHESDLPRAVRQPVTITTV